MTTESKNNLVNEVLSTAMRHKSMRVQMNTNLMSQYITECVPCENNTGYITKQLYGVLAHMPEHDETAFFRLLESILEKQTDSVKTEIMCHIFQVCVKHTKKSMPPPNSMEEGIDDVEDFLSNIVESSSETSPSK